MTGSSFSMQRLQLAGKECGHFSTFMVYGDALYDEIAKARQRLSNGRVDLSQATSKPTGYVTSPFLDLFEAELFRVTEYISAQQRSQELSAKALLTNIDSVIAKQGPDLTKALRLKAREIVYTCAKLQRFIANNEATLNQVGVYADSVFGTSCATLLKRHLAVWPWKKGSNSALVVLSDVFEAIRTAEAQNESNDSKWVAPSSFERSTTKYWVEKDRLIELLLAAAQEAPLLVYGRNGRLTSKVDCLSKDAKGDKLWDSLATPISSVYFDSPSMCMYKERIARREGAQLLRARWYGNKPKGNEPVFLELKTHHEKWVNTKSVKERVAIRERDMLNFLFHRQWSQQVAEDIVLAATPKITNEDLHTAVDLLLRMHSLVVKHDLRPCVRSTYLRAAFQSPKSNSLRLTVDNNITLIDETRAPPRSWCFSDDAVIDTTMVTHVPCPVFEVKLAGSEMPNVIQELEECSVIMEAAKFSKFLTGAASFNAHKLDSLPYWAEHPKFAPLFETTNGNPCNEPGPLRPSTIWTQITSDKPSLARTETSSFEQETAPSGNRTAPKDSHKVNMLRSNHKQTIAPKRPARVEPKTYFANERTFIQWISAALMLVTISVILLDFESGQGYSLAAGLLLNFCACVVAIYAAFLYRRRLQLLTSGSAHGYVDHVGPIILVICVLIGVVVLTTHYGGVGISVFRSASFASPLSPRSGVCYQHSTIGLSNLEFQPSDALVDNERGILLVPTLSQIMRFPTHDPRGQPATLVEIPGTDLEAITYVNDRVFAVSEDPRSSELIELEWNGTALAVVKRWDIPTPSAEGIAYVPDNDKLYISGDLALVPPQERGVLDVYDIPDRRSNTLASPRRLNKNLLDNDMEDSKIAGLTYFDGVLYVLHDNEQIVRAWDVVEGNLLSQFKLPRVGQNYDKQWEGIAFETRDEGGSKDEDKGRLLRRSLQQERPTSSLVMHLALDTPPQVWSFAVNKGEKRGQIILPGCAGA